MMQQINRKTPVALNENYLLTKSKKKLKSKIEQHTPFFLMSTHFFFGFLFFLFNKQGPSIIVYSCFL